MKYSNPAQQLYWLIRLRWCAVIGQIVLVGIAVWGLHLTVEPFPLLGLIVLTALTNIGLALGANRLSVGGDSPMGWILVADTLFVSLLLYFSGGPTNPFSLVYLVHVSIAAVLLGPSWTWGMVFFSTLCFGLLFRFHVEVPELTMHHHGMAAGGYSVHLYGMLFAYVVVALLLGYFLARLAEMVRFRERQIGELRLVAAHHEKLAALTTLAAGAAHELGSPLGTISLAAEALRAQLGAEGREDLLEDALLIEKEIARCRLITQRMSGDAGDVSGEMAQEISLGELVDELRGEMSGGSLERVAFLGGDETVVRVPVAAVCQALLNLIRNGLDAIGDSGWVKVIFSLREHSLAIDVSDNGSGVDPLLLPRIGEPFFTTKDPGKGMGLGVFLARLLAGRLGGELGVESCLGRGTTVRLSIPRWV